MILPIQHRVADAVRQAVQRQFGLSEVPAFAIETPPNRTLGDLAVTVAFQLARALRKPPRAIAQELAEAVTAVPGVGRVVAAPNGYLNVFLDRRAFVLDAVGSTRTHASATAPALRDTAAETTPPVKTIVE